MRTVIDKIKSLFNEIENIKQRAIYIQSASSGGSMFGGNFGGANSGTMGGPDDEMKKSLISDIRNYFTKSMRGGIIGGGPAG